MALRKSPCFFATLSKPDPLRLSAEINMCFRLFVSTVWIFLATVATSAAPPQTQPAPGLRDRTPQVHAFVGAKIVIEPGHVIDAGTLVVREGTIVAVGQDVKPPADARVWDVSGKTIYPGLIDAYSEVDVDTEPLTKGAPYWNDEVRPQLAVAEQYKADEALDRKLRGQGITARLAVPKGGIIKGISAVVSTGDGDGSQAIVNDGAALHMRLTTSRRWGERKYPNSPMGAVALARQAMLDGQWYRQAWQAYHANHQLPRPERNDALAVLQHYDDGQRLVIVDAANELYFLRADRFAREFGLNIAVRGSGDEYRRLDAIASASRPVIVPLNFPKAPNVATSEAALNVSLERLMDWDIAPENPARLEKAGVQIALTSHGLSDQGKFLSQVRTAIERGLPEDAALRALTTTPAKLLGVDDRLGSLQVGHLAHFVIADGPLFADKTKLLETWVSGQRFVLKEQPQIDIRGAWEATLSAEGNPAGGKGKGKATPAKPKKLTLKVIGKPDKPAGKLSRDKTDVKLDHVSFRHDTITATFAAKQFGDEGVAQLSAVFSAKDDAPPTLHGSITWPDGTRQALVAVRTKPIDEIDQDDDTPDDAEAANKESDDEPAKDEGDNDAKAKAEDDEAGETDAGKKKNLPASFGVNYPLGAFGAASTPQPPGQVLFRNATVWTCGPDGILEGADVLVKRGIIAAVGEGLEAPEDAVVVDCAGKHITPGIIDCHSHMATDGGVNESTQTITAEVRIGDFIDSDDITIYRQLAGGVTASNILHGSANTIGGQNQVIKLRWGTLPEEMKMGEAPPGIKFALGENVKQSNWGDKYTKRYPQTRMGVEQIVIDEFEAARAYQEDWQRWRQTHAGLPPRRDLELDAIVEVLNGERWIHCHSYRQDEILALMRTLELYDVTIGSFQHILEGYKVAREMAQHGATGSAFSDWWAYKFEVYDAIPYNGAIMHHAGIVVSFNSDDREMGRHLNHEAAKAVKYGGVPRAEALKFVTLNPARQLRIDKWVGSLEVGKHADLVVWSGDPLSCFSRCEQTWIDGRKYFDRQNDLQRRRQIAEMRATLVQKILSSGAEMAKEGEDEPKPTSLWPREDIFCGARSRRR